MKLLSFQFVALLLLLTVSARTPADRLSTGRPLAFVVFAVVAPPILIGASTLDGKDPATAIVVGTIQSLLLALGTATLAFGRWRCRSLDAARLPVRVIEEG
jgi:hypothetical protein